MTLNDAVLQSVVMGHPVTVVQAPPGGGKSTLIASVCARLACDYRLSATVATPTREQAANMGRKLLDVLPSGHVDLAVSQMTPLEIDSRWAFRTTLPNWGTMTIRTLDSLRMSKTTTRSRLLIVDEAFQAPYALGASAARHVEQILAVGDPGQIGPVITVNTDSFQGVSLAPHLPFASQLPLLPGGAQTFHMTHTYRLGPVTTGILQDLYDFTFTSARGDAAILVNGRREPEIYSLLSDDVVGQAVARVHSLIGQEYLYHDQSRPVTSEDIAVVTSLRVHSAEAQARLRHTGLPDVTVGTSDQLQGGQWPIVIAIDPLAAMTISDHHLSLGRLCVMLSRHIAHCSFVSPMRWRESVQAAPGETELHIAIREKLAAPY